MPLVRPRAKHWRTAWLVAAAMLLSGCAGLDRRAWDRADSWYRFPPPALADRDDWAELDEGRVHLVAEGQEHAAEDALKDASFQAISDEQADQFAGAHIAPVPNTRFYLVRSVYLNPYTGAYRVILREGNVWVRHGSLGHHAVPMRRQALILQLGTAPGGVYATCSMAE